MNGLCTDISIIIKGSIRQQGFQEGSKEQMDGLTWGGSVFLSIPHKPQPTLTCILYRVFQVAVK
jgi:hypothetical protein